MVTEPSPHARRRSRGCGSVLAYGYMFVVFSGVVGLIVGLVLTASTGLSSDVQRVIGAMLLIVSVLVGVLALVFFRLWLGARRAARSPKRELLVFRSAQGRMFQLSGTVVTAPGYLAPLSQRPCVL
jgi:hypothetical protein